MPSSAKARVTLTADAILSRESREPQNPEDENIFRSRGDEPFEGHDRERSAHRSKEHDLVFELHERAPLRCFGSRGFLSQMLEDDAGGSVDRDIDCFLSAEILKGPRPDKRILNSHGRVENSRSGGRGQTLPCCDPKNQIIDIVLRPKIIFFHTS